MLEGIFGEASAILADSASRGSREANGGKPTPAEKKQVNKDECEERDFERRGSTPVGVP
jgi:hypothetical protein